MSKIVIVRPTPRYIPPRVLLQCAIPRMPLRLVTAQLINPGDPPLPSGGEKEIDPSQADTLFVGVTMFDEEAKWQLMLKSRSAGFVSDRDLSLDEMRLIQSVGVVVSASMKYPRADRYGFPDEATRIGFLAWLRTEQRLSTCRTARFRFRSKDRGDDSPMDCLLTVRMPKSPTLQTELF